MTETEWETSTDPRSMLAFLRDRGPVSRRKLRLFVVACCRRYAHLLTDERSRPAVEVAERVADGDAAEPERAAAWETAGAATRSVLLARRQDPTIPEVCLFAARVAVIAVLEEQSWHPTSPVTLILDWCPLITRSPGSLLDTTVETTAYCAILRELFGNPFRTVSFSPEWRTEVVSALARGIYEERAFERMGVLGDALEEVGADPELVRHCREPGIHVRGCHVLDAAMDRT